jgi:hypothetical protein
MRTKIILLMLPLMAVLYMVGAPAATATTKPSPDYVCDDSGSCYPLDEGYGNPDAWDEYDYYASEGWCRRSGMRYTWNYLWGGTQFVYVVQFTYCIGGSGSGVTLVKDLVGWSPDANYPWQWAGNDQLTWWQEGNDAIVLGQGHFHACVVSIDWLCRDRHPWIAARVRPSYPWVQVIAWNN